MNFNFDRLQISTDTDQQLERDEGDSEVNTVFANEHIQVVRRRFIHIKRVARNKNPVAKNSAKLIN